MVGSNDRRSISHCFQNIYIIIWTYKWYKYSHSTKANKWHSRGMYFFCFLHLSRRRRKKGVKKKAKKYAVARCTNKKKEEKKEATTQCSGRKQKIRALSLERALQLWWNKTKRKIHVLHDMYFCFRRLNDKKILSHTVHTWNKNTPSRSSHIFAFVFPFFLSFFYISDKKRTKAIIYALRNAYFCFRLSILHLQRNRWDEKKNTRALRRCSIFVITDRQ